MTGWGFSASWAVICWGLVLAFATVLLAGSDRPRGRDGGPVAVTVDADCLLALGDRCELDRGIYFNLHDAPDWTAGPMGDAFVAAMRERFGVEQVRSYPVLRALGLREDAARPGYVDPACLAEPMEAFAAFAKTAVRRPDLKSGCVLHQYPEFMEVKGREYGGTPADYEAAADLVVRLFDHFKRHYGYWPVYLETMNEPDAAKNWTWNFLGDYWEKFLDYDAQVVAAMKAAHPDVLVGGPCLSWPHYGQAGLPVWNGGLKRYLEQRGGDVDFVSYHNYDVMAESYHAAQREGAGHCLSLGKARAILDMVNAYCRLHYGQTKPIIISEYGTFGTGTELTYPLRLWCHLRSLNAMLMTYLDYQDHLLLTLPFVLSWPAFDNSYDYGLYKMHGGKLVSETPESRRGGQLQETPLSYFYLLWRPVKGRRVLTRSGHRWIQTQAFVAGRTLYWVLHNRDDEPRQVRPLVRLGEGAEVAAVRRTCLLLEDGRPVLRQVSQAWDADIRLMPGETTLIETTLANELAPARQVRRQMVYGDAMELPLDGAAATLTVALDPTDRSPRSARLRLGLQRDGGFEDDLALEFNGRAFTVGVAWSAGIVRFLAPVEIELPVETLRAENVVRVSSAAPGGMLVYAILEVDRDVEP